MHTIQWYGLHSSRQNPTNLEAANQRPLEHNRQQHETRVEKRHTAECRQRDGPAGIVIVVHVGVGAPRKELLPREHVHDEDDPRQLEGSDGCVVDGEEYNQNVEK